MEADWDFYILESLWPVLDSYVLSTLRRQERQAVLETTMKLRAMSSPNHPPPPTLHPHSHLCPLSLFICGSALRTYETEGLQVGCHECSTHGIHPTQREQCQKHKDSAQSLLLFHSGTKRTMATPVRLHFQSPPMQHCIGPSKSLDNLSLFLCLP